MILDILAPAVGLAVLLALIYTLAVHLFMGLGYRGLVWHWVVAAAAMVLGSMLGERAGSRLPAVGDLHVVEGTVAAAAVLLGVAFIGRYRQAPDASR